MRFYVKLLEVKSVVKDEVIIYGLRDKTWTIYFFMLKAKKGMCKKFFNSFRCTGLFSLSIQMYTFFFEIIDIFHKNTILIGLSGKDGTYPQIFADFFIALNLYQ